MRKLNIIACLISCIIFIGVIVTGAENLFGDINRDSKINAEDALVVLKHAANIEHIAEADIYIVDVNQDDKVNASDALEILKFSAGITDFIGKNEVVVPDATEVSVDNELVNVIKIGGAFNEESVEILTSTEEYNAYVKSIGSESFIEKCEEAAKYYNEDFFENSNLMAVVFFNYSSGQYRQEFSKLLYDSYRDLYNVCITTYTGITMPPDTGSWCVFIPVEKSIAGDINYKLVVEYDWEEGTTFSVSELNVNMIKVGQAANIPETVVELKTYDEYVDYVNNMVSLVPDAFGGKVDEVLAYYNAEYFENKSLAAVYIEETETDDYEMNFMGYIYSGGKYCYKIKGYLNEEYTEGTASWCLFAPVLKGYIRKDDYQLGIVKIHERVCDTDKSDVIKVNVENSENQWYRNIYLIDTYDEYNAYVSSLDEKVIGNYQEVNGYDDEYFKENVLVVAEYVDESYSIESTYLKTTEYEDEFVVYIERYFPNVLHEGLKQWNMIIPLEGKEWSEKSFRLSYVDKKAEGGQCKPRTMWVSTYTDMSYITAEFPQYIMISSYEEYKEYVDFIKNNRLYTNGAYYMAEWYIEKYFEENELLLVVIDGTENRYDAEVSSKITDEGEIILNIDRAHDTKFHNNGLIWNVFVPLTGTGWVVEDVTINYTDSYPYEN